MKPMRTRAPAAALLFVLLGAAASAQKVDVKTNKDPNADFTAIRTYAWLPPAPIVQNVAPGITSNPTLSQEAIGPEIVAAVDRQLAARGWAKAEPDAADVHVVYFAALTTGISQSFLGEHYGYITGWGSPIAPGLAPSTSSTAYEKGTIIVDIVQRAAKRGIWHASAAGRIEQQRTIEERTRRINEIAQRMFEKFPVRPKG
jgi:uncharacterized protein DUF4136